MALALGQRQQHRLRFRRADLPAVHGDPLTTPRVTPHRSLFLTGLAGLLAFLLLHLLFLLTWSDVFAVRPWQGYEAATAAGIVEPWFVHTPGSLWLARATFALLGLLVVRRSDAVLPAALALWAGSAVGVVFVYATTSVRHLPGGWAGFVFYPLRLCLPILLGGAVALVLRRWKARG